MYFEVEGRRLRILATLHAFPVGSAVPQFVSDAAQWADAGCMEHDVQEFQAYRKLAPGGRLQELLPPDIWKALSAAWDGPPKIQEDLQSLRPWAAFLQVGMSRVKLIPGAEAAIGAHLARKGQAFRYIERASAVAAGFDAIPEVDVAAAMRLGLPLVDRAQEQFEAMFDRWAARDSEAVQSLNEQSPLFGRSAVREAVLIWRNRAWVESVFQAGNPATNTVLAVGASHCVGPDNFISLLRQRGLAIREL